MNRRGEGRKLNPSTDSLNRAPPVYARCIAVRCLAALSVLAVLGTGVSARAADSDNIFQDYTDEKLSEIAADWQSLTTEERRDYFIEVRRRMAEAGKRRADPAGLPQVVGERRFGRIIPQPDGSVLHIEGVVRYRGSGTGAPGTDTPQTDTDTPPDYGTGFEQRVEQSAEVAESVVEQRTVTAPVVSVATGKSARQTERTEQAVQAKQAEQAEVATEEGSPETDR